MDNAFQKIQKAYQEEDRDGLVVGVVALYSNFFKSVDYLPELVSHLALALDAPSREQVLAAMVELLTRCRAEPGREDEYRQMLLKSLDNFGLIDNLIRGWIQFAEHTFVFEDDRLILDPDPGYLLFCSDVPERVQRFTEVYGGCRLSLPRRDYY